MRKWPGGDNHGLNPAFSHAFPALGDGFLLFLTISNLRIGYRELVFTASRFRNLAYLNYCGSLMVAMAQASCPEAKFFHLTVISFLNFLWIFASFQFLTALSDSSVPFSLVPPIL